MILLQGGGDDEDEGGSGGDAPNPLSQPQPVAHRAAPQPTSSALLLAKARLPATHPLPVKTRKDPQHTKAEVCMDGRPYLESLVCKYSAHVYMQAP
jgi:hypothetical protein